MPAAEIDNYCPFGCRKQDLDGDTGYCRHLVGFTNDGKMGELLERCDRTAPNGKVFYTQARVTSRRLFKITKDCVMRNPEKITIDPVRGIKQVSKMWVSDRVYHQNFVNQHFMPADDPEPVELPELVALPPGQLNPYATT